MNEEEGIVTDRTLRIKNDDMESVLRHREELKLRYAQFKEHKRLNSKNTLFDKFLDATLKVVDLFANEKNKTKGTSNNSVKVVSNPKRGMRE